MKKSSVLSVVLLLLLFGIGAGSDDSADAGINLRHAVQFAKDQAYSSDISAEGTFKDDSAGEDTFSMSMIYQTVVRELDAEGNPIHYACTPVKGEFVMNGETETITKDTIKTSHVTLNKQGSWDSIAEGETLNQGPLSHVFVLCQSPVLGLCAFPDKPVKQGDTWELDADAIDKYAKMLSGPVLRDIDLNGANWKTQGKLVKLDGPTAVVELELNASVHAQDNFPVELEALAHITLTIDIDKAMVTGFAGEVTMNLEDTQIKKHATLQATAKANITRE